MSAENKALARRFFEEFWNQQHLAVADELLAATHVDHTPGGPSGLPPGPAGFKQFGSVYFTAFPDLHLTIEEQVAEGELVVTRWTSHGTNTGSLFGMPATGKQTSVTGMTISRMVGGQAVETWTNFDTLGLLQQLGMVPTPGE